MTEPHDAYPAETNLTPSHELFCHKIDVYVFKLILKSLSIITHETCLKQLIFLVLCCGVTVYLMACFLRSKIVKHLLLWFVKSHHLTWEEWGLKSSALQ